MKHRIKVELLRDEDGEVREIMYYCLTHECETIISMWFLRCLKEDPFPEIEWVEEDE